MRPDKLRLLAAAALATMLLGGLGRCALDHADRPNVILISIDTLRADRLGSFGYSRNTTPAIDGFFRDDMIFHRCFSSAPWTLPAHASLFTSQYPSTHTAYGKVWATTGDLSEIENDITSLPAEAITLAEVFRDRGYETVAFTGGGYISGLTGLDQGFRIFDTAGGGIERVMDKTIPWLKKRGNKPFFLFFHTFQTHVMYNAPRRHLEELHPDLIAEVSEKRLEELAKFVDSYGVLNDHHQFSDLDRRVLSALYDAEVRHCDDTLARLFTFLEESGLIDETIVVFTSDHGEEFWDHGGFEHGHSVYNELLHIPLLIRNPADRGRRVVERLTRQIDIPVSILLMAGVDLPPSFQGRDLLSSGGEGIEPLALAEQTLYRTEKRTLFTEGYKLIEDLTLGTVELYDLGRDFGEENNLAAGGDPVMQARIERMRSLAGELFPQVDKARKPAKFDERTKKRLRSLGYVH